MAHVNDESNKLQLDHPAFCSIKVYTTTPCKVDSRDELGLQPSQPCMQVLYNSY
jgi:hypothetical protein